MIYLFGGSFNPFHIQHENCVSEIKKIIKEKDQIIIIPAYSPWKKKEFLNINERIELIKFIYKSDNNISVSNLGEKYLYMFDIVEKIIEEYNDSVCLVMGQDTFDTIHKWHRYEEFKDKVSIKVINRFDNVSSTLIRSDLLNNKDLLSSKAREFIFDILKK